MSGKKGGKTKNPLLGKRPTVDLESLNPSIKSLQEALDLVKKYPFIMTPFQLRVLCLYRDKEVQDIVKDDKISSASVYAVLNSLRLKRRKAKMYLDLMRKLSRDLRLHPILTLKPSIEDEREEEN